MRIWIAGLFVIAGIAGAHAQQPPDSSVSVEKQKLKVYDAIVLQRNQAMDGMAVCMGELRTQVDVLRQELDKAKNACAKKD